MIPYTRASVGRWLALLGLMLLTVGPARSARAGTETWSLVMNGAIYDVPSVNNPSLGRLLSTEVLSRVAKADGRITIATRPDRGHIVMTAPVSGARIGVLQGFKTASLTLLVNQEPPLVTRGQLVGGVPYIDVLVLQSALEKLGFSVLVAPESSLLSVFSPPPQEGADAARADGPAPAGDSAPGAGMLEAVRSGSAASLKSMAGEVSSGTEAAGVGGGASAGGICQAMDTLRTLWDQTEPSAYEKATFKSLAQKFQQAKDNHQKIDPAELDQLLTTVKGFRAKAQRRADGTNTWTTPQAGQKVKRYGSSFLDSVLDTLNLSVEMLEAMKANDEAFAKRAEEDINTLKSLDKTVQEQGMRFNNEVTRVRQSNGCGPATLGLPPS